MFTKSILIFMLFLSAFYSQSSFAVDEINVVDIRSNIPLSDDEPVYKDFYINAGTSEGLKKNMVITVTRSVTIRDASGAHSFGEITVPVGQLRILAVFGKIAVAREYKSLSRDEYPMLEQTGIMSGDKIDLTNSFIDSKPQKKRSTATVNPAPGAPVSNYASESPVVTTTAINPAPQNQDQQITPNENDLISKTEQTENAESTQIE